MIVGIEHIAAVGVFVVFVAQYIYGFGKLSGKVTGLEENVSWIRNYLLCSGANLNLFKQCSAIDFASIEGEELLSERWKDKLRNLKTQSIKLDNPFVSMVGLSEYIGFVDFSNEAKLEEMELNTLLIASGIFYNKMRKGEK